MVENLVDELDAFGAFDDAEEEVPVLRSVGLRTPAADGPQMLHAHDTEVRQVVGREHEIGRPARLEQRRNALALLVQAVLIGIDEIDVRLFVDDFGDFVEGEGRERIVVIEETDEVTGGQGQGAIGVAGDA